jgi:hypothetical protein
VRRQLSLALIGLVMASVSVAANAAAASDSLATARDLWSKAAPMNYSYVVREHTTMMTVCVGPDSRQFQGRATTITVRKGRIARMTSSAYAPHGSGRNTRVSLVKEADIPESCLKTLSIYKQNLHTIEGLFAFIEREQANHQGISNPETRYDATFGFPAYVDERDILDGSRYSISDFRVLE